MAGMVLIEKEPEGSEPAKQAFELLSQGPGAGEELIINACLRLSAEASNIGLAPAAAAHSFCAGISILEKSRDWLHGEWAGLGLVFQARLCAQQDPSGLLEKWGLPSKLPFRLQGPERRAVAERMLDSEES